MNRKALGRKGEEAAAHWLESQGFCILEKNFRCPRGEIDLIARDGDQLVFIEVRSRSSASLGSPEESVNRRKQQRITAVARHYLACFHRDIETVRFDVIAVIMSREGRVKEFRLIKDAFRPY